jgi:hypothetical protein
MCQCVCDVEDERHSNLTSCDMVVASCTLCLEEPAIIVNITALRKST